MEITGILVKKIGEREGISSKNGQPWKQAEFLLEVIGQHTKHICFVVRNGLSGRVAHFDSLVGKNVTVSFDIDAREYEGRWYNELNAWGVMEHVPDRKIVADTQPTDEEKKKDGLPF